MTLRNASTTANGARFLAASDQSVLVQFGQEITPEANERMAALLRSLEADPVAAIRNLHPGYCSLLVKFDALKTDHAEMEAVLRRRLENIQDVPARRAREVEIPICYGGEFGPDLEELAAAHRVDTADVVKLHSSASYRVRFIGFVPGFAYLSGLPDALATPRLASPRRRIPAGSVGIAGSQTGVYPLETPGGWRLIGRTPLTMFDPARKPMSLLATGDRVRFAPISEAQFRSEFAKSRNTRARPGEKP